MCKNSGCCGSVIRVILSIINVVFILFGTALLTVGILLKTTRIFDPYLGSINQNASPDLIKYLDYFYYGLIGFGAIVGCISLLGLVSMLVVKRPLLIIYAVLVTTIFIIHLAVFIAVLILTSTATSAAKSLVSSLTAPLVIAINQIVSNSSLSYSVSQSDMNSACSIYKTVAGFLNCCDFNETRSVQACCSSMGDGNCSDVVYSLLNKYNIYAVDIPNGVVLVFEFAVIAGIVYVLVKIWLYLSRGKSAGACNGRSGISSNKVAPQI